MILKVKVIDILSRDQVKNIRDCISALGGVIYVSKERDKKNKKEKSK